MLFYLKQMDSEKMASFSRKHDITIYNHIFNWNKGKLDSFSAIDDIMISNDISTQTKVSWVSSSSKMMASNF